MTKRSKRAQREVRARTYSIKELSERSGLDRRTIRRCVYERVVSRPRGNTSASRYTDQHLQIFLRVKELRDRGLTLKRIKQELRQERSASTGESLRLYQEQIRRDVGIGPGVVIGFVGESRRFTEEEERRFVERVRKAYEEIASTEV